jgi:nitrate/TMAO reductase-like tetraheme cytochrome c subunit
MDVDRTRAFKPLAQTCYRCGQTGHISKECNRCHDIHHMTLDEEDEFIQRIMANRDAAVAAAAESTTYTATSEGTLVERKVEDADFVRSSG